MVEQLRAACIQNRWARIVVSLILLIGIILLIALSGGFPPWAWRFLFQVLPQLPQLWAVKGFIILPSLIGLVLLSTTLLIFWTLILFISFELCRGWWHEIRERQQFALDLEEAEELVDEMFSSRPELDEDELRARRMGVPRQQMQQYESEWQPAYAPSNRTSSLPAPQVRPASRPLARQPEQSVMRPAMQQFSPAKQRPIASEPLARPAARQMSEPLPGPPTRPAFPSQSEPIAPYSLAQRSPAGRNASPSTSALKNAVWSGPESDADPVAQVFPLAPSVENSLTAQAAPASQPAQFDGFVSSPPPHPSTAQLPPSGPLRQQAHRMMPISPNSQAHPQGATARAVERQAAPMLPQAPVPVIPVPSAPLRERLRIMPPVEEVQDDPTGYTTLPDIEENNDWLNDSVRAFDVVPDSDSLDIESRPTLPNPDADQQLRLSIGLGLDPGIVRKHAPNEDSIFAIQAVRQSSIDQEPVGLFVVADGMGGHANGQEASRLAIKTMSEAVVPAMQQLSDDDSFEDLLKDGAHRANLAVYRSSREQEDMMGTTLTAALVVHTTAYVVNVGDSRTYLYRPGEGLHQISKDHSIVARLVESGAITTEEVYTHPKRNQIYRCLGEHATVEIDTFAVDLQARDMLILCSDGLWEMVRDRDLERIIAASPPHPPQLASMLIQAALHRGGADNISVVVVSLLPQ